MVHYIAGWTTLQSQASRKREGKGSDMTLGWACSIFLPKGNVFALFLKIIAHRIVGRLACTIINGRHADTSE